LEKLSGIGIKKWRYSDDKNSKTYTNHVEASKKQRVLEISKMQLLGVSEFLIEIE
jgi:hypothetical protein